MKLLLGESLEDRLNRQAPLPVDEVLRIGSEIAEGLAVAHERGLIHRDIKPANIWLEEGRDRVKIVDFGLARTWGEDTRVTQTGYLVGTPAYMAPEQAEGDTPVDFRADLFSLGCVLYRMATGELPFKGKHTMAVLLALATKTPRPPREINPALPSAFDALVRHLLEKEPADRPQSAREVVAALSEMRAAPPEEPAVSPPEEAEDEEVEEELEVEEEPPAEEPPAERPGRRKKRGRRKQRDEAEGEDSYERFAMRLAVVAGVAVFLLLAFLIGRHYWRRFQQVPKNQNSAVRLVRDAPGGLAKAFTGRGPGSPR
jgi:serine/threonine protein kinase